MRDKLTHSTQTDKSHYRRESETQHYVPKSKSAQTKRSNTTYVPTTKHYLAGLRNSAESLPRGIYQPLSQRDYHFKVFDMTIDQDGRSVPYGGGAYGLPPKYSTKKENNTETLEKGV